MEYTPNARIDSEITVKMTPNATTYTDTIHVTMRTIQISIVVARTVTVPQVPGTGQSGPVRRA
jgi:hypothetical protein